VLLPPGTTNKEIDLDFVYTALKSFFITCAGLDDNVTITLRTNSTGAPVTQRPSLPPARLCTCRGRQRREPERCLSQSLHGP
jgi:hypothetical protein